jgi:hypothetical protein
MFKSIKTLNSIKSFDATFVTQRITLLKEKEISGERERERYMQRERQGERAREREI